MEVVKFNIEGVLLLKPNVFFDERGYFFESFNQKKFDEIVKENIQFTQDNQSLSQKNTLRGLHFQVPPYAQGKLVRVVKGRVIDLLVDIRKESKTYGKTLQVELSGSKHELLWIPKGFAHGFYTVEDDTIFQYKCTDYYHPKSEGSINWGDSQFDFKNSFINPILSEKDDQAKGFDQFISPF